MNFLMASWWDLSPRAVSNACDVMTSSSKQTGTAFLKYFRKLLTSAKATWTWAWSPTSEISVISELSFPVDYATNLKLKSKLRQLMEPKYE